MTESADKRYRYVHRCTGCDGSYAECQPLWAQQRVCCPDCDHHKAHPPVGALTWREKQAELEDERDVQMEAGHA